ncbi:MAG: hypothetical protein V7L22_29815 [Nostoc sp.]|uniref:hypothetical protein n=1 Tax=Nostoc sp. TaxID=1180 RepID=UPI002FF55F39
MDFKQVRSQYNNAHAHRLSRRYLLEFKGYMRQVMGIVIRRIHIAPEGAIAQVGWVDNRKPSITFLWQY